MLGTGAGPDRGGWYAALMEHFGFVVAIQLCLFGVHESTRLFVPFA